MDEEILSVISSGEGNATSEVSDSISTSHPARKRQRSGSNGTSSRFKGVIRQKNGQWGAQLYANHTRIWLGTFKSETDAGMAYDSAAIKFRTGDTHRNFPLTDITVEEPKFQSNYSAEAVLSMIRDGSYQYKFMDFLKNSFRNGKVEIDLNSVRKYSGKGLSCKQLFQKELTPSDVGKLNRLVIPKKYAVKYFPLIEGSGSKGSDAELIFYDKFMRLWKFRYCYWNSSQSFVFTRGWNRFLKEKELKANDVISFYVCESRKEQEVQRFCMIDVNNYGNDDALAEAANLQVGREVDLQLRLGHCYAFDGGKQVKQEQELMAVDATEDVNTTGFKLFGMQIN
ncbi:PREDICTED: AP2/ERF and B3 domain-containing transcription factor At1g50680 [Theobroma cacao]|uniref:AP2/ERF and B3 domain-containing transcription factor At1g50680 n=1 Tax=Theobroma cacao TaxID=3641 RepID=A0AB32WBH6_THECC|nr:PREDICTED: AP2/ERF and B3 domain-containing transcription factor At1g50680 [Theobroma cacao]XP_017976731.1 PREDICTED: AP2/ERF and B3 domain-containing transcription factor At1g50680 [Theobroma cacao]XP_017976732.1 PREDICTED: AP2/ERF and B3 domain-containing transcription factor At1g50680 [Theobroma cacao]